MENTICIHLDKRLNKVWNTATIYKGKAKGQNNYLHEYCTYTQGMNIWIF